MAWEQLAACADPSLVDAVDQKLQKAMRAIGLHEYSSASRLLADFLAKEPHSYIALDLAAFCALHTRDYDTALSNAVQCTAQKPTWARGWARLGAAQLSLGHHRAAVSAYEKGLTLDANNAELQLGLRLAQQAVAGQGARRRAAIHDE